MEDGSRNEGTNQGIRESGNQGTKTMDRQTDEWRKE